MGVIVCQGPLCADCRVMLGCLCPPQFFARVHRASKGTSQGFSAARVHREGQALTSQGALAERAFLEGEAVSQGALAACALLEGDPPPPLAAVRLCTRSLMLCAWCAH